MVGTLHAPTVMAFPTLSEGPPTEEELPEVEVKFRRDLGLRDIVMIGLGPTIGTTIFTLIGPGIQLAGSAILLVLVLNFIVTIFTAMAYVELASVVPETGGGYLWVKTAFSKPVGFLAGWLSWFGHSIVCAFYVVSFGLYIVFFSQTWLGPLPNAEWIVKGISIAVLAVFLFINFRGTRTTGKSGTLVTIVLAAIVGTYVAVGLIWFGLHPQAVSNLSPFLPGVGTTAALNILMAMGLTFVVFEGYEIIAQTGEEVSDPGKNLPRAIWITLSISTALFVLVGFVTLIGLPPSDEKNSPFALLHASGVFFGDYSGVGIGLIVFGVGFGSLASVNSLVFSSSRVAFAMGRDAAMPRSFGRLHPVRQTPAAAIFTSGLIIILMILTLDLIQIAVSADLMFLLLFTLVNAAAIRLRQQRPDLPRTYVTPFFPVIPILGLGTKAILAVALYLVNPLSWYLGIGWVALGLAGYYVWARRERIVEVARAVEEILPLPEERFQIMVPLESPDETDLVKFAALVGRVEDGAVTLLNVVEVPPILPIDAIDRKYLWEIRVGLSRAARIARDAGVEARSRVVVSRRVFEAIIDAAKESETDVLIVGWKGPSRADRILGSNLDQLVQAAPCDVVVFKTAGLKEKIDKILVFNAPAWHVSYATGYAILLAKQHRASLTIYTAATTEEEMAKERVYSARLAQMCSTHGVPYEEKFVQVKSTVDAVVEEAKGYDLLAVGASEEWARMEYAFGSVQDQIAQRAPCPVLMVRKVRRKEGAPA